MSQVTDYTISGSPLTMTELAAELEAVFAALGSANRGVSAPDNPFEGMFWWDETTTPVEIFKRYTVTAGWVSLLSVNKTTGAYDVIGFVPKALFDADTILVANSDNTPVAVTVAEQRIVGRKTGGGITALTGAETRAINGTAPFVLGSDADGDMYYRASSVLARLAKGTAGQLLKMKSDATAPEWGNTWKGTATNDNAAAGYVGEYVSAHLASGSAVALTSAAAANITSISLTAGDWDVDAYFALGSGTDTLIFVVTAAANSTSATIPATWRGGGWGGQDGVKIRTAAHGSPFFAVPTQRFSLSGTTTIYLVGYAAFSVSTLSMFGGIAGRRVR